MQPISFSYEMFFTIDCSRKLCSSTPHLPENLHNVFISENLTKIFTFKFFKIAIFINLNTIKIL